MVTVRQQVRSDWPRHLVRARLHRRRSVRHPAARRSRAGGHAVPAATRRRVSRHRRQRRCGDRGAARADQPLRHPARSARTMDGWSRSSDWWKSPSRGCAVQPVDHRPLRADAGGDRPSFAHGAGRGRRGAADRRHGRLIGKQPFHGLRYGTAVRCGDKIGFLEAQIAFALKRPDLAPAVREFLKSYRR